MLIEMITCFLDGLLDIILILGLPFFFQFQYNFVSFQNFVQRKH